MEYLLSYLPPSLRLVIAAGFDPPLPLARMRARGELTEIRAADLRFRAAEAAVLVTAVSQIDVAPAPSTRWWSGPRAGLRAQAGRPDDPRYRRPRHRCGGHDHRHTLDFLSSEVLDRLPADRRAFLVRTAVLDRLSGPLCDAVVGRSGSAAELEALERADLFVVALDDRREWFRSTPSWDVLTRELHATAAAAFPELLGRAAAWYLAVGQVDQAVRLLKGRRSTTSRLGAAGGGEQFLEQGAAAVYLQLGDELGEETVRREPRLAVSMAGAAAQSGRLERVPAARRRGGAPGGSPSLRSGLAGHHRGCGCPASCLRPRDPGRPARDAGGGRTRNPSGDRSDAAGVRHRPDHARRRALRTRPAGGRPAGAGGGLAASGSGPSAGLHRLAGRRAARHVPDRDRPAGRGPSAP